MFLSSAGWRNRLDTAGKRSAELLDKSFIPGEYHIAKTCHCCVTGITLSRNESPFLMLL